MKFPILFGFYGESNSGKTSLIIKIVKKLGDEGYKISAVKITDKKISIDTKGKDTWKYSRAGSKLTVLSSPIETDYMLKENKGMAEIIQHIKELGEYDLIIVEGAHDKNIPKIRIGNIPERENTLLTYNGDFEAIINLIKNELNKVAKNMKEISIKVNGKQIPLTEFPSGIIKNTIIGMLNSLKGVDEKIENVEIKF